MSLNHLLTAAAVLVDSGPAASTGTSVLAQSSDVGAYTLTTGRFWGTAAALVGLVGTIIGGMALVRSRRGTGNGGKNGAIVALVAGLIALAGGAVNLGVADGGPGTGNGVVGGGMAVLLGLIAVVLGGLVVARSRRTS